MLYKLCFENCNPVYGLCGTFGEKKNPSFDNKAILIVFNKSFKL